MSCCLTSPSSEGKRWPRAAGSAGAEVLQLSSPLVVTWVSFTGDSAGSLCHSCTLCGPSLGGEGLNACTRGFVSSVNVCTDGDSLKTRMDKPSCCAPFPPNTGCLTSFWPFLPTFSFPYLSGSGIISSFLLCFENSTNFKIG